LIIVTTIDKLALHYTMHYTLTLFLVYFQILVWLVMKVEGVNRLKAEYLCYRELGQSTLQRRKELDEDND
jgi:hypothetical protein